MNVELLLNYLESLRGDYMDLKQGAVASYIPELTKADPEWFGIALVTIDGRVYQVGDTQQAFTIQSISKAVTYGIALEDHGVESVMRKIDVEPSGEAFNSISLEPGTGRPRNAMINAGAIAAMSFIAGDSPEAKQKRTLDAYKNYLGHEVSIDEAVYRSEKSTGHRNRAIAYLLRNSNIIESDPDVLLDLYFRQCSILVNCRDLAILAATLANGGVNPITGVSALKGRFVPKVLSVMTSCGMYDYSGAWIYEVGMPAKSGVGGGIIYRAARAARGTGVLRRLRRGRIERTGSAARTSNLSKGRLHLPRRRTRNRSVFHPLRAGQRGSSGRSSKERQDQHLVGGYSVRRNGRTRSRRALGGCHRRQRDVLPLPRLRSPRTGPLRARSAVDTQAGHQCRPGADAEAAAGDAGDQLAQELRDTPDKGVTFSSWWVQFRGGNALPKNRITSLAI